jgi:hypothetical protein
VQIMEEAQQDRIAAKARELHAEARKLLAWLKQSNVQREFARHGVVVSWIAGGIAIAVGVGFGANSGNNWLAAKWTAIGVYAAWMGAGSILLILGWVLSGFAEEDMPKEPWAALIWSGIRGLATWVAAWLLADSAGGLFWGWSNAAGSAPLLWAARLNAGLVAYFACWGFGVALMPMLDIGLTAVRQGRRSVMSSQPVPSPILWGLRSLSRGRR